MSENMWFALEIGLVAMLPVVGLICDYLNWKAGNELPEFPEEGEYDDI